MVLGDFFSCLVCWTVLKNATLRTVNPNEKNNKDFNDTLSIFFSRKKRGVIFLSYYSFFELLLIIEKI